ncbi:hypothetical protein, partial [Streptococcus sp. DD11]
LVPLEYKEMLENLGFDDIRFEQQLWTADKEKGVYLWITRDPYRDDDSTEFILLWKNQQINLNVTTVANLKWSERDEITGELKKGLVAKAINYIHIPSNLKNNKKEIIEIIKQALQNLDYRNDVEFRSIADPEVR